MGNTLFSGESVPLIHDGVVKCGGLPASVSGCGVLLRTSHRLVERMR